MSGASAAAASGNANMSPAELANHQMAQQLQQEYKTSEVKRIENIISKGRSYVFEIGEIVTLKHANGETLDVPVGILSQYLHTTLQTNRLAQQKVYDMIISKNKSKFENLGRGGTGSSNIPQSDDDIFKGIKALMASPASTISLPPNTGTSTARGYISGLPAAESILNVEVTSQEQFRRELANRLRETGLERGNAFKERTSQEEFYTKIKDITNTLSDNKQHPTLLELCQPGTIHHCLRTIHHYFGAFMDHGHDWKNITWCVLMDTLRIDTTWLNGMVGRLPTSDASKIKIREWIATWAKKVLEIREGKGVSEARCREYLDVLNEEYIRLVKDPTIMGIEPLADWLISSFEDTYVESWEFTESERPAKMAEMTVYLKNLGIRIVYTESGANWMEFLLEPKNKLKQLELDKILKSDKENKENQKLFGVSLWPHAAYNAASCGVTYCSATAGPCTTKCTIPLQIDSMEILGAKVDVVLPSNTNRVNLDGIALKDKASLEKDGGILILKYGHYVILLGDPVELSLNALAKQIDASVGTYRRGDANNSKIVDLDFRFSANIPSVLKAQLVTILKTWTDAIQLRGVSALKKSMNPKSMNAEKPNSIVVITLDTMCMKSAATEDVTFILFSSVADRKKASSKHKYTLHCFDNAAIKVNADAIFNEKRKTFAWICEKVHRKELKGWIDALMDNKSKQLMIAAEAVADPTLFFACHQLRESVKIHKTQAHNRCDEIEELITRINNPITGNIKINVENAIKTCPDNPSGVLEKFTSLRELVEKFKGNIKQIEETNAALDATIERDATYEFLLQSFTSACQDVRNSGIGKNEKEIELYAVCMMVMEYVKTNHLKAIAKLIEMQGKAFQLIKDTFNEWEATTFPTREQRTQQLGFEPFKQIWVTTKKSIDTAPQLILKELHHTVDPRLKVIFSNSKFKDIMKVTSMCLYILYQMMILDPKKKDAWLQYPILNETSIPNETDMVLSNKNKKLKSNTLEKFKSYLEQLKEQTHTFSLRIVGVSFSRFVEACRENPNLFCKECPIENKCVMCIGSVCSVGHSSSSSSSSASSANAAMNVTSAPSPPRVLGTRTSSEASLHQRNSTGNGNTNSSAVAASASAAMNNTRHNGTNPNPSSKTPKRKKGGGTKKRKSQTRKRQPRKRQTRNRKARKTRKN
jgi:hypothetical protein